MMLHDRTSGDNDGFRRFDAGASEIRRMKIVKPFSNFFRGRVGKKEADLAFYMLPALINI